jgi:hypothetical protein
LLAFVFFISFSSAVGVSFPYWEENPAAFPAGSEGEISLLMQNTGDTDYVFSVSVSDEAGIVSLKDKEVEVPAGSDGVPVMLNYAIPEDASVGTEYMVTFSFRGKTPNDQGGIEVQGVGIDRKMPFVVVPKPVQPSPVTPTTGKQKSSAFVYYLIGMLVVAGIVVYFVMRKKKVSE